MFKFFLALLAFFSFPFFASAAPFLYTGQSWNIYKSDDLDFVQGSIVANGFNATIAPDGNSIFWLSASNPRTLYMALPDGSNPTVISSDFVRSYVISPDSTYVLYSTYYSTYLYKHVFGTQVHNPEYDFGTSVADLAITPDGSTVFAAIGSFVLSSPLSTLSFSIVFSGHSAEYIDVDSSYLYFWYGGSVFRAALSNLSEYSAFFNSFYAHNSFSVHDGKLWVQNGNDTYLYYVPLSGGSPVSTGLYSANYQGFRPIYDLSTCTDGIKNQNETDVDFGGVCGVNRICNTVSTVVGVSHTGANFFPLSDHSFLKQTDSVVKYDVTGSWKPWITHGWSLELSGDVESVDSSGSLVSLSSIYPYPFTANSESFLHVPFQSGSWNRLPASLSFETYDRDSFGFDNGAKVYVDGFRDGLPLGAMAFNSFVLSGSSDYPFRVRYLPIMQDYDNKEYSEKGLVFDTLQSLTGTFYLGQYVDLPFATRKVVIDFVFPAPRGGADYRISYFQPMYWHSLRSTSEVCRGYTDDEIAAVHSGSLGNDGVRLSYELDKAVMDKIDKVGKWKVQNPALAPLVDYIGAALDDLGINKMLDYFRLFVPAVPVTTIHVPVLHLPDSIAPGSVSTVSLSTELVNLTSSGLSMDMPYATSMRLSAPDYAIRVSVVNFIAAVFWGFFCLLLFTLPFLFPLLVVSIIRSVTSIAVPDVADDTSSGGNVFTFFAAFGWVLWFTGLVATSYAIIGPLGSLAVVVRNDVLAVFTFAVQTFGTYAGFQYWANALVSSVLVGVVSYLTYKLLKAYGHLT